MRIAVLILITIFFSTHLHASPAYVPENESSLIVEPLYAKFGDTLNGDVQKSVEGLYNKIKNNPVANCVEKSKTFVKKEDAYLTSQNQWFVVPHTGFPLVSATPESEDQLATNIFFQEKETGKFFVSKWSEESFPLTFTLTEESKSYYPRVKEVFDQINKRLKETGVSNQKLIILSNTFIPISKNNCNMHIIHFDDSMGSARGFAFEERVTDDETKLGQIFDADILMANLEKTVLDPEVYEFAKNQDPKSTAEYFKFVFNEVLSHEIMHTLGVGHNFALGTLMDYTPKSYSYPRIEITKGKFQYLNLYDMSLAYESEVLKFLYKKNYKKSAQDWALVRSTNSSTNSNLEKAEKWEGNKKYTAQTNYNSSSFLCFFDGKSTDLTSQIWPEFNVSVDFESIEGHSLQRNTGAGYAKVEIKSSDLSTVYSFKDFQRVSPILNLRSIDPIHTIFERNPSAIYNKLTRLVLDPAISDPNKKAKENGIHWQFQRNGGFCDLRLGFSLIKDGPTQTH